MLSARWDRRADEHHRIPAGSAQPQCAQRISLAPESVEWVTTVMARTRLRWGARARADRDCAPLQYSNTLPPRLRHGDDRARKPRLDDSTDLRCLLVACKPASTTRAGPGEG